MGATPKDVDLRGGRGDYGQTPNRRDLECVKCGVERMEWKGTDPLSGVLLFVGPKCLWYIKNAPDLTELP